MYRTADCLEDLDIEYELNSYDSVSHAVDRFSFFGVEEKYHDVDYYLFMLYDSEEEEIRKFLNELGLTAWLEYDLEDECKMVKIE